MSFLTKLFGTTSVVETKASATASIMMVGPNDATWTKRDYAAFAREGYIQNVVAFQAINKIAEAVSSVRWEAWRGEIELKAHPLLDLIAKPNPTQSGQEFFSAYVGFLMISGNAYAEKVRIGNVPRELYVQRSDRMAVVPSDSGFPAGYEYRVNGRKVSWPVDAISGQSDVLHTKLFHPLDDWYGLSPMEAAAYGVDQHNLSMAWMQALLQNSARPSGALVMGQGGSLSDDQFSRLKESLEDQYSGSKNAGRPMLLEGGLDWKEMGMSPVQMGSIETKNSVARDICLAMGVPPMLMGIPGDSTYANYAEARLAFWEDTVLPLVNHIGGDLNGWFANDFGGVELRPALDQIPAIVEKRQRLWEMADKATDLTINERREMKGYPKINGGDQILINAGLIPLSEASLTLGQLSPQGQNEITVEEEQKMIRLAYGPQ
jgi:HK97 family phage portal protein